MRHAYFSDVHLSEEGFSKLIAHEEFINSDKKICLGDIFNATEPETAKDFFFKVKQYTDSILLGNHEAVFIGKCDPAIFNEKVQKKIQDSLDYFSQDPEFLQELSNLPEYYENENVSARHASFDDAKPWHHVRYTEDVQAQTVHLPNKINIVGHSHIPYIAWQENDFWYYQRQIYGVSFTLDDDKVYVVNTGSILGSREMRQYERTFLVFDDEANSITFHNLEQT